jgi:hypothetical protein
MAFIQSFTANSVFGNPSEILFTDTSSGSDVGIVARKIYLLKYDGTYLQQIDGQNFINWAYSANTLLLDILKSDTALSIRVDWSNNAGAVLYTYTVLTVFNMNASLLDDTLIAGQQAQPNLINNTNYYLNRIQLRVAINDAINSITQMSDITNSQQACDRGTYFVDNQSLFF